MREYFNRTQIRILVIGLLVLILFAVLIGRLYQEQIGHGQLHSEKISRQSIRRIRIPALRGRILTSDLEILADNIPAYDVCFYLEEMRQPRVNTRQAIMAAAERLAAVLGRPNTLTREQLERHINLRPGLPLTVCKDLNTAEIARVYDLLNEIRGIAVVPRVQRIYPFGPLAAVLIGYTRLEDPKRADDFDDFFYYIPDLVGQAGVEKVYDEFPDKFYRRHLKDERDRGLRGKAGFSLVQVDNMGFIHDVLVREIEPEDGNNVVLTLDSRAQEIAEKVMQGVNGALVLLDSDTGDVLAMVSTPGYDLSRFSPRLTPEYFQALKDDPNHPMMNRALSGAYAPGSILKPLVELAFLENGIGPSERVHCDGRTYIGKQSVRCASWRRGGHGDVDAVTALQFSCNDYFIELGLRVGYDRIKAMLISAGIGQPTGFELGGQAGLAPDRDFKKRVYKMEWNAFDTALLSIGQGIILVTPLQAAMYTAALNNGGRVMRPHLVKTVTDLNGKVLFEREPAVNSVLAARQSSIDTVREGMFQVINNSSGTGRTARNRAITLYGKTGTAQVGQVGNLKENSWFICFGSRDRRNYAMAVLVEDSINAGRKAAPVAAQFFEEYLGPEPEEP